MKPQEILGMVEEAAGTRMFEERKDKAKKTMGKKEKRVEEITSLLNEEITPKLDNLRREKRVYLQWQKSSRELETLGRTLRAAEWHIATNIINQKESEIEQHNQEAKQLEKESERFSTEAEEAEKVKEDVERRKKKEREKGGRYQKLEEEVRTLEKEVVKVQTQVEIKTGSIEEGEERIQSLEKERKDVSAVQSLFSWACRSFCP